MPTIFRTRRSWRWSALIALLALASLTSGPVVAAVTQVAPVASYTDTHGGGHSSADFKGHPTMLFLLSSWCGTCAAGLQSLNAHADEIRASGLHLTILRTYRNEGGDGLNIAAFASKWAPALNTANVTLGNAGAELEAAYNPHHVPDIYYLIDAKGRIQAVDSAPSITMDKILAFAHQPAGRSQ